MPPCSTEHIVTKVTKQSPTQVSNNIITNSVPQSPAPKNVVSPTAPIPNASYGTPPPHSLKRPHSSGGTSPSGGMTTTHSSGVVHSQPPIKKPKLSFLKDMSAAEAGKYATLAEYAFFDKVCWYFYSFVR